VLGEIPRLRGSLSNLTPAELMVHPGAANVIDALQTLRANLTFALIEKQYPWFVVTSADPNEGKSFVSTSLAWMLASVNRSTILVDGDSRRPTGHRRLGRAMGAGLGDVGPDNLREVLETTSNPYLRFLGAGDPDRHPAEIASTHLPHLLNQVETTGEVVIIDSPPLPLAAETIVYVSGLGSALLVIDARRRDLTNVERVVTTLSDRGVSILGVVINRSRRKISGGKYYAKGGTSRPQRTRQPEPSAAWTQPMSPTMTATRSSERPADTPDVLTVRDAASSSPFATSWPDKQPLTADDDPAH
jgi:capsular exopolysaccharide synthesis family protein